MTQHRHINPPGLMAPEGSFSWASRVGETVYLAGHAAVNRDGRTLAKGDAGRQLRHAFDNIEVTLSALGGDLNDLVRVITYIAGKENLRPALAARRALHKEGRMRVKPAGTVVVVEALGRDDWLVEVEGIAVLRPPRRAG